MNSINFYKLVKMLRGWEKKYTPADYDRVIKDAFVLIDSYGLKEGEISPYFTLPNDQLEKEFIKKFLIAAEEHEYKVFSEPAENEGFTKFHFTR